MSSRAELLGQEEVWMDAMGSRPVLPPRATDDRWQGSGMDDQALYDNGIRG